MGVTRESEIRARSTHKITFLYTNDEHVETEIKNTNTGEENEILRYKSSKI